LKTALWLQNGPWRSSVLGTNRQAATLASTKHSIKHINITKKVSV